MLWGKFSLSKYVPLDKLKGLRLKYYLKEATPGRTFGKYQQIWIGSLSVTML